MKIVFGNSAQINTSSIKHELLNIPAKEFKQLICDYKEEDLKALAELSCLQKDSRKLNIVIKTLLARKLFFTEKEYDNLTSFLFATLYKKQMSFEKIKKIIFEDILFVVKNTESYIKSVMKFSDGSYENRLNDITNFRPNFIPLSSKLNGERLIFLSHSDKKHSETICLDGHTTINGHTITSGKSGFGKTTYIKDMLKAQLDLEHNLHKIKIKAEQYLLSKKIEERRDSLPKVRL